MCIRDRPAADQTRAALRYVDVIRDEWNSNVLRIHLYPTKWRAMVARGEGRAYLDALRNRARERGMWWMVDNHVVGAPDGQLSEWQDPQDGRVDWARKFRRFAKSPDAINFVAASHRQIAERLATQQRQVDCIVLGELLEHVLDPMDVIGTLQMVLKPGGLVIITMPWGPWETGYGNKPQHIREWTAADLQDVFGEQADLVIDTVPCDENPHVGESRGYTCLLYTSRCV